MPGESKTPFRRRRKQVVNIHTTIFLVLLFKIIPWMERVSGKDANYPLGKFTNRRDRLRSMTEKLAINIRYQYLKKLISRMRREIKKPVEHCSRRISGEEKAQYLK